MLNPAFKYSLFILAMLATEIPFGNETRRFKSFYEASAEVSWSRVYGGIHYPETARISIAQGKEIGNYVLKTLYAAAIK